MSALWNYCVSFVVFCNCISSGNSRKGTADNWPSETTRENEEKKKAEAMVFCRSRSLNVQQRRLCYKFPIQVAAVFRGFREAAQECQHQFRNERWNCSFHISMPNDQAIQPLMMKLLSRGFKEVAFVHALVAAAVAKTVSLDCARRLMSSCDRLGSKRRRAKKQYGSYDVAIAHGMYFSEKFLNSGKSRQDAQGIVDKHNLRAGRLVFINTLKTMCKCHGLSGTCSLKTCVKIGSDLRLIGYKLKTLYDNARKVEPENQQRTGLKLVLVGTRNSPTVADESQRLMKSSKEIRQSPSKNELLYTEDSPSFCERDVTLGILGVTGRICSKDPSSINSCSSLCCGRGYNQFYIRKVTKCACKFKFCCSVQCNTCNSQTLVARCK